MVPNPTFPLVISDISTLIHSDVLIYGGGGPDGIGLLGGCHPSTRKGESETYSVAFGLLNIPFV